MMGERGCCWGWGGSGRRLFGVWWDEEEKDLDAGGGEQGDGAVPRLLGACGREWALPLLGLCLSGREQLSSPIL